MSTKPPAFQFYPKDYESDELVKMMSLEQEGAFLRLLCHAWLHGSIPSDRPSQGRICRVPTGKMARLWPGLERCFVESEPGRLVNKRQERQREAQEVYREGRAEAGRRGAEKRRRLAEAELKQKESLAKAQLKPPSPSAVSVLQSANNNGNELAPAAHTPPTPTWSREASEDWTASKGGPPPASMFTALKAAVTAHGWQRLRPVWQFYLGQTPSEFVNVPKFTASFGEWESRARGQPAPGGAKQTSGDATMAAAARVLARHEGRGR